MKLNFYTKQALDIVRAAKYFWYREHRRTWFGQATGVCFDEVNFPAGEIAIRLNWHKPNGGKIDMIGWAIKDLLKFGPKKYYLYKLTDSNPHSKYTSIFGEEDCKECMDKNSDAVFYAKAYKMREDGNDHYETEYVAIPVKLAWIMYDLILGHRRSTVEKKFGSVAINTIVGQAKNPMAIEQTKLKNEELAKAQNEFSAKVREVDTELDTQIRTLREERNKKVKDMEKELEQTILTINQQFEEMAKLTGLADAI